MSLDFTLLYSIISSFRAHGKAVAFFYYSSFDMFTVTDGSWCLGTIFLGNVVLGAV